MPQDEEEPLGTGVLARMEGLMRGMEAGPQQKAGGGGAASRAADGPVFIIARPSSALNNTRGGSRCVWGGLVQRLRDVHVGQASAAGAAASLAPPGPCLDRCARIVLISCSPPWFNYITCLGFYVFPP